MARILVVDDAAFMRMMLKDILTKVGHEIVGEASNGREALVKYETLRPEIVTMDITMPDCDGLTCVSKIKEMDPDAKIIMCSAMGQKLMVVDAIKRGASDFIVKPFQAEQVIDAVNKIIKEEQR